MKPGFIEFAGAWAGVLVIAISAISVGCGSIKAVQDPNDAADDSPLDRAAGGGGGSATGGTSGSGGAGNGGTLGSGGSGGGGNVGSGGAGSGGQTGSGGALQDAGGSGGASMDAASDRACTCPLTGPPVCGIDGHTYTNQCQADCAGVKVAHDGACECAVDADCMLYGPTFGDCCGTCQPKTAAPPVMLACLVPCPMDKTLRSCTCVLGKCAGMTMGSATAAQ